jgi:hypothetical protein
MLKIPTFFHEILGETQTKFELTLILSFVVCTGLCITLITYNQWVNLSTLQMVFLILLYLDISGGVISNLTTGTKAYYQNRPRARLVFIAIHIQPLLLAWLLDGDIQLSVLLWIFTLAMALLMSSLRSTSHHRVLCGAVTALGLTLSALELNPLLRIFYMLYVIKVLYNFSVNYASQES